MRILGVDPGTIAMGYGVIEDRDGEIALVDCGALTTQARSPIGERLSFLYNKLMEIVSHFQPDDRSQFPGPATGYHLRLHGRRQRNLELGDPDRT